MVKEPRMRSVTAAFAACTVGEIFDFAAALRFRRKLSICCTKGYTNAMHENWRDTNASLSWAICLRRFELVEEHQLRLYYV